MKRLYLIIICFLLVVSATAQSKKRKSPVSYNKQNKETDVFLQKQWWLGFRAGANLSKVNVDQTYSILSPTNYEVTEIEKKYDNFKQLGSNATIEVTFYFKGISLSFQPTYQHTRFIYTNTFQWRGDIETNRLDMKYEQEQKVDHFIFPLLLKYEFPNDKIRPYLQAGIYSAYLLNANKYVTVSGIDYASGGTNEFENEAIIVGAKDLFAKNHWGLLGGAGVYYNLGNVRLNLDVVYKHGMSNISSTKNRYSNDRLAGIGDAMDDLTLDNVSVSLGALFPLRFLASGFKSLDKKN